ncbi:late competence protein ComER [Brevibacillus invocatus]
MDLNRIGVIGTGSMGSILLEAWLTAKALSPTQLIVHNRTPAKAVRLAEKYPGLSVAQSNTEVAQTSSILLLCVKPSEYNVLLEQLAPALTTNHLMITITSPIKLKQLETQVPCPVARVVPSITNAAKSGVSLCEFGSRITQQHRQNIFSLFSTISQPIEVSETYLRVSSDITSCGPAFLSYILQQMIEDAEKETGLSHEAATYLVTHMLIGMGELLKQELFTLPTLQQRVCVPGGITGEGLVALQKGVPGLFAEVFHRTHAKFAEDQELVQQQWKNHVKQH